MFGFINVLMPTRGRSAGLLRAHVDSVRAKTFDHTRVFYSMLVDWNDTETLAYLDVDRDKKETQLIVLPGTQVLAEVLINEETSAPHLALFYNRLYKESRWADHDDVLVGMVGDDMRWVTPEYDQRILIEANERNGRAVICCDDGFHHSRKRFVNMFIPRKIVDATRRDFMCPYFPADYTDDIWCEIATALGISVFLDDVVLYHDHNSRLPQDLRDETCQRLRVVASESRANRHVIPGWVAACVSNVKASGVLCEKS